uniref:Tripartite motif-containing protein 45 n=1 Tax=Cacopsylla melanoneura TaxID=428564 RepID=A0A8D8RDX7_9HEMI
MSSSIMNGLEELLESTSLIGGGSPVGGGTDSMMNNNNNHGGSIEEEWNSEATECYMCNAQYVSPRLLSCLHVFCECCLNNALNSVGAGDAVMRQGVIQCVQCDQETKIGPEGVSGLPLDYMINNALDLKCIHDDQVVCTACVTKEKAVARCKDCAQFLCTNCTTAHQFMKCFDNHHVIFLKELLENKKSLSKIHKSIYCDLHNSDLLSLYCYTCQQPICNTCRLTDHKAHQTELSSDALIKQREELTNLVMESQGKIGQCEQLSNNSDELLSELECEHDNARGLIDETYQTYKNILEKCRDELVEQLEQVHKQRELKIMDSLNVLEKTIERVEQGCKYTNNLLDKGSEQEVLALKRHVSNQLLNLINNTPKPDVDVTFQFVTDGEKFKQAVKATFGKVVVNSTSTSTSTPADVSPPFPSSSLPPSGPAMPPPLITNGVGPISLPSSSMTSSPISMLSSFEDFNAPSSSSVMQPAVLPTNVSTNSSSVNGGGNYNSLSLIQEYNLAQLANLVAGNAIDKQPSPPPLPLISSSSQGGSAGGGGGGFTIAELLNGAELNMNSNAFNNIQALAKLGSSSGLGDISEPQRSSGPGGVHPSTLLSSPSPILPPPPPPLSKFATGCHIFRNDQTDTWPRCCYINRKQKTI